MKPCRKRTRIWNNVFRWEPRALCMKDCGNIADNRHVASAQRGPSGKRETWATQPRFTLHELNRVPPELIHELLSACV